MNIARIIQQLDQLASRSRLGLGLCELRLRQRFNELPIPQGLAYLLASHWPQTPELAYINYYIILTSAQILSRLNFESLLPYELLQFGDSGGGDMLAFDLRKSPPSIVVIGHDEFVPGDDPRQFLADVAPNLEEFLAAALAERSLPSNYYEGANGDDRSL